MPIRAINSAENPSAAAGGTLRIAVNPEFMREGSSLADFVRPPLTLVGSADPATASILRSVYGGVEAPFVHTAVPTAEMVKYVANAFHALKVCFANEIADVCDAFGADAQQVSRTVNASTSPGGEPSRGGPRPSRYLMVQQYKRPLPQYSLRAETFISCQYV